MEVKSDQKRYQKAKAQLFDGLEKLKEVFSALGLTSTHWLYVGVFFALLSSEKPLFDCEDCSIFAIVGKDSIYGNLKKIEEKVAEKHQLLNHQNWIPEDHIQEFINLAKETLFIAQGDPHAPVTEKNVIEKTLQHIERVSHVERILFWTSDQLSLTQAENLQYVVLDGFYSTGKSSVLQYFGKSKRRGKLVGAKAKLCKNLLKLIHRSIMEIEWYQVDKPRKFFFWKSLEF